MKAFVFHKYGSPDVLRLEEVEKPTPKEDEVLVKVQAASVNALDWHMLTADIFLVRLMGGGLFKPKNTRIGADVAGQIEAVGRNVTQFKVGDAVFGDVNPWDGGGFAEYVCVPAKAFVLIPPNISFEEAAAVPIAGITALQGLRDQGQVQPGQQVLINGAAGGVGTFAVQIARHLGAEVTAVCSTRNLEQARALGAAHVIDYTKEDFTKSDQQYDLIFAVNGYHPHSAYKRALKPEGRYVMAGGTMPQIFQAMLLASGKSKTNGKKMGSVSAKASQKDLIFLTLLLEEGKIVSTIDKTYPFSQTPEAIRYLGSGHARAKVVIVMEDSSKA
ncbi:MAG: NAD(P)-dependent alcohol dehydrogenase [Desulfobacterales bacterium]|nr:NAD(P)-dependent alcohol dehydrogenase [Desulfobacterales bacterium]